MKLLSENSKQISRFEDLDTIKQVLDGDVSKFKFLQNKYTLFISLLIRKMVKDQDDVDDLVQETFIKAYKSLSTFNSDYAFSSWLYKIASNTCIDFIRKRKFNVVVLSEMNNFQDNEVEFEISDISYVPDLDIINKEKTEIINKAIEELPEKYKVIIKLRHNEDMDYSQIANILAIPIGTVKVNLFRARKILELTLRKHSEFFGSYKTKTTIKK